MEGEAVVGFVAKIVSTVLIVCAVSFVLLLARKEAKRSQNRYDLEKFVLYVPATAEIVGWIDIAFFAGFVLYFSIVGWGAKPWIGIACFGVFIALGAVLVVARRRWRLEVRGDELAVRPFAGRKRTFTVKEATHFTTTPTGEVKVYAGGRKLFAVDTYMVGSRQFVAYLRKKGVRAKGKINLQWGEYIND